MSNIAPRVNSFLLGMFVHSDVDDSDLDVYEFRVWGRLCRRAGDNGRVFESAKRIAEGCQISEKQVRRALHGLQEKGWLELVARYREDGSQTTNDIILNGPPRTARPAPLDSQTTPPCLVDRAEGNPREGNPREVLKDGAEKSRAGQKNEAVDVSDGKNTPFASSDTVEPQSKASRETQPTSLEKVPPAAAPRPEVLRTPQFEAAWAEWLAYRRGRKLTLNNVTLEKQLKMLAQQPDPAAVIEQSITQGWAGLFALKAAHAGKPKNQEEANQRFVKNVAAGMEAIKGVFDE